MLQALDDWLIDEQFQKGADWLYMQSGISCYRVAILCAVGSAALLLSSAVVFYSNGFSVELLSIVAVIYAAYLIVQFERNERQRDEFAAEGVVNEYRISLQWYRLLSLLLMTTCTVGAALLKYFDIVFLLEDYGMRLLAWWFLTVSMYFGSCTPRPRTPLRRGAAQTSAQF